MLTINFKMKVLTREEKYNKEYALNYLELRKKNIVQCEEHFRALFQRYNINLVGKTVLDLAAGVGMDLKILSQFQPKLLIWHDKMSGPYEVAKDNLKGLNNVIFNKKDLMDLEEYKNNSVDLILCRDSLYYVSNDYYFLKQIKRILKQGGYFWATNCTFGYYKNNLSTNEGFLKKFRHYFFDWPLYKFLGLRVFAFLPIDGKRVKHLFQKLSFNIVFLQEKENEIEFLVQK